MLKSSFVRATFSVMVLFLWTACNQDDSLPIGDLPAGVKSYVEANYPNYTIDEAETDTDCSGATVYDVEIEQGEENDLELTFDTAGNFLYTETEISLSDLPVAVTNSIASNYAGFTAEEPNKMTLADGSFRYEVDLEKGKTDKEVLFDAEGIVICERDDE